jgi:hypothetical protein
VEGNRREMEKKLHRDHWLLTHWGKLVCVSYLVIYICITWGKIWGYLKKFTITKTF